MLKRGNDCYAGVKVVSTALCALVNHHSPNPHWALSRSEKTHTQNSPCSWKEIPPSSKQSHSHDHSPHVRPSGLTVPCPIFHRLPRLPDPPASPIFPCSTGSIRLLLCSHIIHLPDISRTQDQSSAKTLYLKLFFEYSVQHRVSYISFQFTVLLASVPLYHRAWRWRRCPPYSSLPFFTPYFFSKILPTTPPCFSPLLIHTLLPFISRRF